MSTLHNRFVTFSDAYQELKQQLGIIHMNILLGGDKNAIQLLTLSLEHLNDFPGKTVTNIPTDNFPHIFFFSDFITIILRIFNNVIQ